MRRIQLAGHKPLGLVGGSTGLIGDPRPDRRARAEHQGHGRRVGRLPARADRAVPVVRGRVDERGAHGQQPRLDRGRQRHRLPARHRQALPRRHDDQEGRGRAPASTARRASRSPSSATRCCRASTSSSCTASTAACCRPAAATSGATSPAAPTSSTRPRARSAHAIGTPLITNSDGTKFGKSEGNAVWLDAALTTPYAFYQFWLNTDDADVISRLKVFTFLSRAEIEALEAQVAAEPFRREAQRVLARDVTVAGARRGRDRRRDRRVRGAVRAGRPRVARRRDAAGGARRAARPRPRPARSRWRSCWSTPASPRAWGSRAARSSRAACTSTTCVWMTRPRPWPGRPSRAASPCCAAARRRSPGYFRPDPSPYARPRGRGQSSVPPCPVLYAWP